jgi:Uncharacterized protein conserved in bacteria (DUF2076)
VPRQLVLRLAPVRLLRTGRAGISSLPVAMCWSGGEASMDQRERQVIDELFGKLQQVERQAPQRDAEAEAHIRQQVGGLPAAPYYMA